MQLFYLQIPLLQLVLGTATYYALSIGLNQAAVINQKFEFMVRYDLGYVCLAVYFISLARNRLGVNVSKNDEFCIKNEKFCIKNEE